MLNFLNAKSQLQNVQAIQQAYSIQRISNIHKENKLTDIIPAFSMKALASQIKAMAEQDNKHPIGENLNIVI